MLACVGKLVQYVVLYCDHIPLYQSGIAGRSVRMYFWIFELSTIAALTFVAFITLDPDPSYLLAISTAINVVIIAWCMHRLYAWRLLLSPAEGTDPASLNDRLLCSCG